MTGAKHDPMLARIQAFDRAKGGGGVVERINKGYSLFSADTGAPIARLRPIGTEDKVEIRWWRRERWAPFGAFGRLVLPLEAALECISSEPAFWIHARAR
jgi:hypothetical protein